MKRNEVVIEEQQTQDEEKIHTIFFFLFEK